MRHCLASIFIVIFLMSGMPSAKADVGPGPATSPNSVTPTEATSARLAARARPGRGCKTEYQKRVDPWGNNLVWTHPDGRLPNTRKTRLVATSVYLFCRGNLHRPPKVKPVRLVYCYTHMNGNPGGLWFQDAVIDTRHSDDDTDVEPWAKAIPDDGTAQNCVGKDISSPKWLFLTHSAHWVAYGRIRRSRLPDHDWHRFQYQGHGYKFYQPWLDPNLGPWRRR